MDIRVSSYMPLTVTRFGATANAPAATAVTNSAANGPVPGVNPVTARPTNVANAAPAPQGGPGQLIDIYV